jgi:phytoene desaturase
MNSKSVIVIGAGIGGLTAAIHLAHHGFHVTIVEKNSHPGGRCDRFNREGHRFDTGPTLFVMPLLYEAEFRAMGASMHEQLDLQRVDPTYHLVFEDRSQLALTSDLKAMQEQLEAVEPGSFQGLLRYLEEGARHYELTLENVVNRSFCKASDFFRLQNLALLTRLQPLIHHYRHMSSYFQDPRLKAAFTFQDIYMGLSPFNAPATYSLMSYSELAHGVWYPKGGMYSIVEALTDLADLAGVEFLFDTPVERIDTDAARARGIILGDGSYLAAGVILANADLPYVYQELLPQDRTAKSLANKRFSCSVISFFWGMDKIYTSLGPHTLFLSDGYRENFESIERGSALPSNPSLYVHAASRIDASMAPAGQDTLTAIIPVGHLNDITKQDWNSLQNEARQEVFRRLQLLGITDLESHIKFEEIYTPCSWRERYNLMKGSTHGLAHTLNQMAYFRPSSRHSTYQNLYFVGASTHPGTGIPTAMVSGRLASNRIKEDC